MPPWKYVRMYLKKNVRMCLTKSALMFPGTKARMLLTSVVKTLLKKSAPRCGRLVLSRMFISFNNTDIFRAVFPSSSEYETLSYTMLDMQKAVNQEMCHHVTTQVPRENCQDITDQVCSTHYVDSCSVPGEVPWRTVT